MERDPGSFRDPSGFVFLSRHAVLRTINACYAEEWNHITASGLLAESVERGLVLPFSEVTKGTHELPAPEAWKTLRVDRVPFLSYPYEWSFSQLRDAALLTLTLQKTALEHGCVLKDASAFNVQFMRGKPVFIDLLSFERWREGRPWSAYGQFCMHFLAPLALMAKCDLRCGVFSRQWVGGIPLDVACKLLPFSARFSPGLFLHLFLHASMQRRHEDGRESRRKVRELSLSKQKMLDIVESLERLVMGLSLPGQRTEWGDYYEDTNYTQNAAERKKAIIAETAAANSGEVALDLGANTGNFSKLMAPHFHVVLAADLDPLAVDRHYRAGPDSAILPLVVDMTNPTPAIGWRNRERSDFFARCDADMLTALALVHHLVITGGIPLPEVAIGIAELVRSGRIAVVEFVPKSDSQVQRLLAARDDVFSEYSEEHYEAAFINAGFTRLSRHSLPDSERSIHVFQKR